MRVSDLFHSCLPSTPMLGIPFKWCRSRHWQPLYSGSESNRPGWKVSTAPLHVPFIQTGKSHVVLRMTLCCNCLLDIRAKRRQWRRQQTVLLQSQRSPWHSWELSWQGKTRSESLSVTSKPSKKLMSISCENTVDDMSSKTSHVMFCIITSSMNRCCYIDISYIWFSSGQVW